MEIDNPLRVFLFYTKMIVGGDDECWVWIGARDRKGYGQFRVAIGKMNKAHIFSFLLHGGKLKDNEHVDHKCNNPPCQNPRHLRALTNIENNARSSSPSAVNARKTHCIHGHEFSGDNLKFRKDGSRICVTCTKERAMKKYGVAA